MAATGNTSELQADPQTQAVARTYADAFLDAAPAGQVESLIEEYTSFVTDFLEKQTDFRTLLVSAMVSRDEKLALISRTVAKVASPTFANYMSVLAKHERLDLLTAILHEVQRQHEIRTGRGRVQVVSARALSPASTEKIQRQLAQTLPFQPVL